MRLHEMRELNADDLKAQITDTRREIVSLRFQLAALKLTNPAKLKGARKQLSRLLTIQGENARNEGGKAPAKKTSPKKASSKKTTAVAAS
jgi:ribosomal protein L29